MVEKKDVNELVIGRVQVSVNNADSKVHNVEAEITLKDVFPALVEFVKLRESNYTGDKKGLKAYFNFFRGTPQVTFKYGKEYAVFDLTLATKEEMDYNRSMNYK